MQWHTESYAAKAARKAKWRSWFAWYPVQLAPNHWAWLERVECRQETHYGYGGTYTFNYYKGIQHDGNPDHR